MSDENPSIITPVTSGVGSVGEVIARSVSSVFTAASSLVSSVITPSVASLVNVSTELPTTAEGGMVLRKGKGRPPSKLTGSTDSGRGKKKAAPRKKGKEKEGGVQTREGGEVADTDGGDMNETEDDAGDGDRQEVDKNADEQAELLQSDMQSAAAGSETAKKDNNRVVLELQQRHQKE